MMRNITVTEVTDTSVLKQPMTPIDGGRRRAPGGITGTGNTVDRREQQRQHPRRVPLQVRRT